MLMPDGRCRLISPCLSPCFLLFVLWWIAIATTASTIEITNDEVSPEPKQPKKVAVVTLVTTSAYAAGAEVLAHSLKQVNATGDRVLLYVLPEDDARSDLSPQILQDLQHAGWTTIRQLTEQDGTFTDCKMSPEVRQTIQAQNPQLLVGLERYWGTCGKFAVWTLTEYDAVVYVDADSLVLGNFDFVYDYILNEGGAALAAQGTPACWEEQQSSSSSPDDSCTFYGAFLVIRPLAHVHDFLRKLANRTNLHEGEQPLLNKVISKWTPLPRYTLVAQSETARPRIQEGKEEEEEVDWSRVKVYDFAGPPVTKPWVTYALQKQSGDKYAHGYYGRIIPNSVQFHRYMYPQWVWNDYYDAILERKRNELSKTEAATVDGEL
jgi:hypothetical protein